MSRLVKEGLLDRLSGVKLPRCTCEPRIAGKATIKPFGKASRASSPLELINSDIFGPMNVKPHHEVIYFITLIGDSQYVYVYTFMRHLMCSSAS